MTETKGLIIAGFLLGLILGGSFSWWVNSLYVKHVEQEFIDYQQYQKEAYLRAKDEAQTQQEESSNAYRQKEDELQTEIAKNAVLDRAIAAGRLRLPAACPGGTGVFPSSRTDAGITYPIPPAGTPAEEASYEVVNDCAITTLMLNELQADIEKHLNKGM